jgi:hypothetical protein
MVKCWRITGYNGDDVIFDRVLHGNIGHKQVEELLVRLYARHLTVDDIFEAAMKKPDALKPVKTGHGSDYTTPGRPFYYTADHGDA